MIACAAIAMASSTNARNVHSVIASWWVAMSTVRFPVGRVGGRDGVRRHQQRRAQGDRAHDQRDRGVGRGQDAAAVGAQGCALTARGAHDDGQQGGRAGDLGQHRPDGRPGDPEPVEGADAVDQQQVERDVEAVAGDRDDERGAGVLQPAQDPGRGEHDQQRDGAEEGDPQVRRGVVGDLAADAERRHERLGRGHAGHRGDQPDQRPPARPRRCPGPGRRTGPRRRGGGRRWRWCRRRGRRRARRRSAAPRPRCPARPAPGCRDGPRWRRR